jgi:hypothetical protein
MKLPDAERAVVDLDKLRDYSLNLVHDKGKHKARVFAAAMGFTMSDAEKLREMILAAVLTNEALQGETDEHGTRYAVDFNVQGLRGLVRIRTAWIIDVGQIIPRLTSCFLVRKKGDG